jgi:hypothetical protein
MRRLRAVVEHLAIAIFVAIVLAALDRSASAKGGLALPTAGNTFGRAPISLLDSRPPPLPPPSRFSWLRARVPGPTGTSVWGASLSLPFTLHVQLPHTGTRLPVPLRPTDEIEIGFRSLGSATGGVIQYVTPGGMRFGGGLFFNKIAVGAPPAHQAMLMFRIPLP